MKRLFSWQSVAVGFVLTVITAALANGNLWGTAHLQALVPGVIIPDLTPWYSPQDLPGFFRDMGERGRAAYITVNNLDFLLIASYMFFVFAAAGTMLRYIMPRNHNLKYYALLGLLPATFDAIESFCFRLIVTDPANQHVMLSTVAAFATKAKFLAINLALAVLLVLAVITVATWLKRRRLRKDWA